jgi:hypothetical protein
MKLFYLLGILFVFLGSESLTKLPDAVGTFAVVGDTQRTLWAEKFFMGREQNEAESRSLLLDLSNKKIDFLTVIGDLVAEENKENWNFFDEITQPLRTKEIPFLAIWGNHDRWGSPDLFLQRFPDLKNHPWYSQRYGSLYLIFLDSNVSNWNRQEWYGQVAWYEGEIKKAESDPSVKGTLVFSHHPPFTNSMTTGDEGYMQEAFLPAFYNAKKTLAFISGHAHAYEHFEIRHKSFLVSGGGGGPRVKLLEGVSQRHKDLFVGPSPRPFHYLLLHPDEKALEISVWGFQKGESEAKNIDSIRLPFGL